MTVKPNDLVAGYHFVQKLGEGATGTVWLARERDTHLLVAIKLLRTELFPPSSAQVMYERLVQSISRAGRFTHPNLAQTRSTFHQPRLGLFGIVSEYLEGQTLDGIYIPKSVDGRPGASDPRTLAGVLAWFQQIATVLAWLHANGVVHGNVKPRNVMLMTGYDRPIIKLLDLCWSEAQITGGAPEDLRFVSPEQIAGAAPSPASDQWACGKLLHHLLVSSAPPGSQLQALATAPVGLLKVVQHALQTEPRERFPDTGGLFYAIEAVRNHLEQEGGAVRSWEADKRVSQTALVESVGPSQTENVTVPMVLDEVSLPSARVNDGAARAPMKSPVGRTRGFEAQSDLGLGDPVDPLGVDELFEPSGPPLIPEPAKAERRRRIEREPTWEIEAYDDDDFDEKPPRSWTALIGVAALALAFMVVAGAIYVLAGSPDIPILARPHAAGDPAKAPEATKPDAAQAVAEKPEPAKTEASKGEAEPAKNAEAAKAEAARAEAKKAEADKAAAAKAQVEAAKKEKPSGALEGELALLDADCHAKKASACSELGDRYAGGKGTAVNVPRAAVAHERACDLGRLASCPKAGELLLRDGGAASARNARRVFEKACDRQVAAACAELSRLYAEGVGGPANDRLSKAFRARACGLGLKSSCP
jgi:serine/threonine protein kinase